MSEQPNKLFQAYADKENRVSRQALIDVFSESGIRSDDPRVVSLFKLLKKNQTLAISQGLEPDFITPSEFGTLQEISPTLFENVLSGQLAIPQFAEFSQAVAKIFEKVEANHEGHLANYIPQLERVSPDKFGLSICSIDGQRFDIGDSEDFFCVQSCSKPITYCLALEEQGEAVLHRYVGTEPSGKTFNELTLNAKGLPHNPMINAGAIMCGALIKPGAPPSDRFDYVMSKWKDCAGSMKIGFDNAVYLSERQTADRNFALGYFMREKKAFPKDANLQEVLEFYFQCCSIEVTTQAMSIIAATLANGGNCPLTGAQVFRPDHVKNCLSLMSSCGMYDFSGEFAFRVGIPAKSGVSGAIMLVVPNVLGMAVWSPRLDELGNSVRGVDVCLELVSRFKFHTFDSMLGLRDDRSDPRRNIYDSRLGGTIAFCCAASEGDVGEMRRLVARGLDPGACDYDRRTALHLAASEGKVASLRYLLELGVEVNPMDRWGNTPLDDAERQNHLDIISVLTEHGGKRHDERRSRL
ncbi:MAG: glutaminase A [Cyanobacteria bacterium REEB67]|nr:glutaminase A [Cyanobacteria bacterium REEB67]